MGNLARTIADDNVPGGSVAIYWLAQAGFVFKNHAGKIVYIDPYLSEVVERLVGFKRMMACPIAPEEVLADLVVCTHEHPDHLDIDALPVVARNPRTHFAGPSECVKEFVKMGVPEERCHLLEVGRPVSVEGIQAHAVYADHGELSPDAIGVVLDFDGIKVYHTGDTAYKQEAFRAVIAMHPEVLIPCINGCFGNLNPEEAALLARDAGSKLTIASHFWMFVEQDGDPASFLEFCSKLAPGVGAVVMKPGERVLFRKP